MRDPLQKLIPFSEAAFHARQLHSDSARIVSTNGCFDLLHLGHLNTLREARGLGSCLWIGLNSDASVRRLKGLGRPLNDEKTRALQLAALEAVDFITVFDDATPQKWLELVRPAVHVKGGDYRPADLPERAVVEAGGGTVACLPFTDGYSTTSLIERIRTFSL